MLQMYFPGKNTIVIVTDIGQMCLQNAAYLFIRGMKTLHLRVQQQNSTGMRMAELLEAHPKVPWHYYDILY
jgi:cystathionine beta-lyase/cystathionine gamma-synthase